MFSTVYDVKLRYSVEDRAARSVSALRNETRGLGREARATSTSVRDIGMAVIGAVGAQAAGKALIGFNSTVEDTRLQIGGMLALTKKTDLAAQFGAADRVFGNLQKRAASLPGTTMEYARMAGMLTQPIMDAGLGLKDLENITVNSVVGAKALGVEWQAAARDIDQALRGQFHSTDVFTGKILGSTGYKGEEGRAKFNALTAEKRAAELQKALLQPQLTQLADAQGQTFSGVVSTLQDTIEQVIGKVGLPLFKAITTEVKAWNQWLDQNKHRIDDIAATVGGGLVKGFTVVKDALGFLVQHADLLMALGKVWIATKVGGMVSSGVTGGRGIAEGATSLRGWMRKASDGFNAETGAYEHTAAGAGRSKVTMGNLGGSLPLLGQAAALGFAFGTIINESTGLGAALHGLAIGEMGRQLEKVNRAADSLTQSLQRAADANPKGVAAVTNLEGARENAAQQANLVRDMITAKQEFQKGGATAQNIDRLGRAVENVNKAGLDEGDFKKYGGAQGFVDAMQAKAGALGGQQAALGVAGSVAWEVGIRQLTDYQRQTLDESKAQQDLLTYINNSLARGLAIEPKTVMELLRGDTSDPTGTHKSMTDKPKVTVHINRIEVQSDDPDRMAFGLIESFRDAAKNPSSAFATLREG